MNRLMPFVNWNHINKKAKNRDVVFFGSGNIAEKTSQKKGKSESAETQTQIHMFCVGTSFPPIQKAKVYGGHTH